MRAAAVVRGRPLASSPPLLTPTTTARRRPQTTTQVEGDTVTVSVPMPGLSRGGSKVKVSVDEVVRADAARAAYEAAQRQQAAEPGGDGGRESAYGDLLARVNAALAALEAAA
jgi:hypothetical protein